MPQPAASKPTAQLAPPRHCQAPVRRPRALSSHGVMSTFARELDAAPDVAATLTSIRVAAVVVVPGAVYAGVRLTDKFGRVRVRRAAPDIVGAVDHLYADLQEGPA